MSLHTFFLGACILLCGNAAFSQAGMWTWKKGSNAANSNGSYGVQGVSSPLNEPPARYEAAQWTDAAGNLWLYGGGIGMQRLADLWKYDAVLGEWTWMHGSSVPNSLAVFGTQGVPAPANTPGGIGFGASTWTDAAGNLWLYGGDNGTAAPYGDLWKFDPAINMWTWVKGPGTPGPAPVFGTQQVAAPANTPGGLEETACNWVDQQGRLWVFGGTPSGIGAAYDALWMYDPATSMWTWMKGASSVNAPPVYGTLNVPSPLNTPGARWCYTHWTDNAGNLWLFGGVDAVSPVFMGFYNDLWMYDMALNMWVWKGGSQLVNQPGVYGTKCVPAASNVPGGRGETRACWTDSCGYFWLLGGRDLSYDLFNDLWRYDPNAGMWTWISGSATPNQPGVYGVQNVAAPANVPGGRQGNVSWYNAAGLWLFGGEGSAGGQLNDLWLYVPDTVSLQITATPLTGCAPLQVNFNAVTQGCGAVKSMQWTFGDPASGSADTAFVTQPVHVYNAAGTYTITCIVTDCQHRTDTSQLSITVTPGITLQSVVTASQCISSGAITVTASGGAGSYNYAWQPAVSTQQTASGLTPGTYIVTVTDANGCAAADTLAVLLADSTAVMLGNDTVVCFDTLLSVSATGSATAFAWSTGQTTASILVSQSGIYSVTATEGNCTAHDSVQVLFVPQPVTGIVPSLCETGFTELSVLASSSAQLLWSTGDTLPLLLVDNPGTYTVTVNDHGCLFTDSLTVNGEAGSTSIYFPNSFTPDNDGLNETFRGYGEGILEYDLKIFNRWGELVFHATSPAQDWDGKVQNRLVQEDVYVWVATYRLSCNENREITRRGHVSVIR